MHRVLLTLLTLTLLTGCIKEELVRTTTQQEVSFGIAWVDPMGLKNDPWDFECPADDDGNLLIPTTAQIDIRDADGNVSTYNPQVFFLNGNLYTQAIKLKPGSYEVTKFFLLSVAGTIIMATPAEESAFRKYVRNPVNYSFEVEAFQKSQVEIDVLCFISEKFAEFGFFWFEVTEIVIRQFCFFGDICANGNPYTTLDFAGSGYEDVPGGLQIDMPAIFEIHIYRTFNGQTIEVPNSPFSNLGNANQPLCVSYPDRIRIAGEEFSFELWILVPDGDGGFEYQHYHTFTSTDGGPLSTDPGSNNVIEFVLGNCNYTPTDLQLEWGTGL
jgi:hypothetical protein